MDTITQTTTKQRRKRIAKGVLITSSNRQKHYVIKLFNSLDIQVVRHFNPISYSGDFCKLVTISNSI